MIPENKCEYVLHSRKDIAKAETYGIELLSSTSKPIVGEARMVAMGVFNFCAVRAATHGLGNCD